MILLFTYGTLQEPEIQSQIIGRNVNGQSDMLRGYRMEKIGDEGVFYPIIYKTGNDTIEGAVLEITEQELTKTDFYEGPLYQRSEVVLESGTKAWVYHG